MGDISQQTDDNGPDADRSNAFEGVISVLDETLQLGGRANGFTESTALLGEIAELDSMAVLSVLTGIEEYFGIEFDDDDVSAESFESVGSLVSLVIEKSG